MKIGIIGTGYVGLVTGTCFADLGNDVICVDKDKKKISQLLKGEVPIYEPGLSDMVKRNIKEKRLKFTSSIKFCVDNCEIIFIAVGTPSKEDGWADLTFIEDVASAIAKNLKSYRLIVEKSTVPVETGEWVDYTIRTQARKGVDFDVASNPEFLREGSAIEDFMNPDRIVIGVSSKKAEDLLKKLYAPLKAQIVVTDVKSAEIIKHASNSFLATKISFINAVSNICEKAGADIVKVAEGMGLDRRIGKQFLNAGLGYGGSCFPKDVDAFIKIAGKLGYDFGLLKTVKEINQYQIKSFIKKIEDNLWILKGKTVGVLGLSFKPDTDDMRMAASIPVIEWLKKEKALIKVFDPQAMLKAKEVITGVVYCKDAYEVARSSSCLLVVTEWNEFKQLDLLKIKKLMKQPLVIDGRNIFDPVIMEKCGFKYICVGRRKK
jgi:UDPglucose 6-dehydrogenase